MKRILLALILAASTLAAAPRYQGFVEGNGRFFDFLRGGGATLWVPAAQDDKQLLFFQGHGGYYRKFLTKWSVGGGYRRLYRPNIGWGVNAFYDIGHSDSNHNYFQAGAGLEAFGPCWIVRANGYLPKRRAVPIDNQATLIGTLIVSNQLNEVTYAGFDVESGYGIPLYRGELWGYAGYYYHSTRSFPLIQGPRLRGEYTLYGGGPAGPQLSVGGEWRYDQVNKSQGALIARLRIPLSRCWKGRSGPCTTRMRRRMGAPVHRELNIWVEQIRQLGQPVANILFFAQVGAAAAGTQSDPTTIADAVARAGVGDVLFALDSFGPVTGDVPLKNLQQLAGFGGGTSQTLSINGLIVTIPKTSPGGRGTLAGITGSTLARGNVVKGIGFSAGSRYLLGTNYGDVIIDDILATGHTGGSTSIELSNSGNLTMTNSTVTSSTSSDAIRIISLSGSAHISNGTLTGGRHTIQIQEPVDADVSIFGNQLAVIGVPFTTAIISVPNTTSTAASTRRRLNLEIADNSSVLTGTPPTAFTSLNVTAAADPIDIICNLESNNVSDIPRFAILHQFKNSASTVDFAIHHNTFSGAPSTTVAMSLDTTEGIQNLRIENNSIRNFTSAGAGQAFLFDTGGGGSGTVTALVNNNTIVNSQSVIRIEQDSGTNGGRGNYTVTNNRGISMLGTKASYDFVGQTDPRATCYTIENNASDTAFATPLTIGTTTAGTVEVFPSAVPATLSAANNGMTTTVGAGVTTAPNPCPLPPPIP